MYLRYLRIIDKKSEQIEEKTSSVYKKSGIDGTSGTGEITGILYHISAFQ